jgi:hypothetical protein
MVTQVGYSVAERSRGRVARRFGDFGFKITVTISWFGSQNQVGFSLLVAP